MKALIKAKSAAGGQRVVRGGGRRLLGERCSILIVEGKADNRAVLCALLLLIGIARTEARFDVEVFAAALAGYQAVRPFGAEERETPADAVERIALELAARFCGDAFEERYFGWDPARFPTRGAHNLQGRAAAGPSQASRGDPGVT